MALDPYFAQILGQGGRAASQFPALPPEEEESLLRKVLGAVVSPLQYVGETLDKPGRAIRGLLAGRVGELANLIPFSDTLGLTDPAQSTSGRDLLESAGVLDANTPGFDAGDVAGFGAEVLLDPLTYLGGVGLLKSLGKGGTVAQKVGANPRALSRVQRMTTPVRKAVADIAPETLEAATKKFGGAAEFLAKHGDKPVGGLLSYNLPFGGSLGSIGTGETAQKIGALLDRVGQAARYGKIPGTQVSPGQMFAAVFHAPSKGVTAPELDLAAKSLSAEEEAIRMAGRSKAAEIQTILKGGGALDDEASMLARIHYETGLDLSKLTPEEAAKATVAIDAMKPYYTNQGTGHSLEEAMQQAKSFGINVERLVDPAGINHVPRQFVDEINSHVLGLPREDRMKAWKTGTEGLRKVIADKDLGDKALTHAERRAIFDKKYGDQFIGPIVGTPASFGPIPDVSNVIASRYQQAKQQADALMGYNPAAAQQAQQISKAQQMAGVIGPQQFPGAPVPHLAPPHMTKQLDPASGQLIDVPVSPGFNIDPVGQIGRQLPPPLDTTAQQVASQIGRQPLPKAGSKVPTPEFGRPVTKSDVVVGSTERDLLIDELLDNIVNKYTPEQKSVGGYGNHILQDTQGAYIAMKIKTARVDGALDVLKDWAKPFRESAGGESPGRRIDEIFQNMGLKEVDSTPTSYVGNIPRRTEQERGGALVQLAKKMGRGTSPQELAELRGMKVDERIADQITKLVKPLPLEEAGQFRKWFDSFTNLFKVGMLAWPARHVRDRASGAFANVQAGVFNLADSNAWKKFIGGGAPERFLKVPEIKRMLSERSLAETAENAADMMREIAYAVNVIGEHGGGRGGYGHLTGEAAEIGGRAADFASQFPGNKPLTAGSFIGDLRTGTLNMFDVAGVQEFRTGRVRLTSENKIAKASHTAGAYTDSMNRGEAFVNLLMKGTDPLTAKKMVDSIQVPYSPDAFTRIEKNVLKRIFPFYSFTKGMTQRVADELLTRPGGPLAQTIRATSAAGSNREFLPSQIAGGAAIPFPFGEESPNSRFITKLGLMHEQPFEQMAIVGQPGGGGVNLNKTIGRNVEKLFSSAHPAAGLGYSLASGRDPFFGRETNTLYPSPTDSPLVNTFLMRTPLARAITSGRKALDERKGPAVRAADLLTGVHITDLPGGYERAKDIAGKKAVQEYLEQRPNVRGFTRFYVKPEDVDKLSKDDTDILRLQSTLLNRQRKEKRTEGMTPLQKLLSNR